ncbi:MAG: DUF1513 domain-containing protein [Pseudomonadota bacterium]
MPSRRAILAGLAAATALPRAGWADAGAPSHVTAALDKSGAFALYGLRPDGALAFRVPLPARGHAAAVHPTAPEAVAFARRPGTFALVLDCQSGAVLGELTSPPGRHFYGHGAFSRDGTRLYTTENIVDTGEGRISIWSRSEGYRRIGDFPSGGIGPHEVIRIPGTTRLAIANGGIRTHPATGRDKLNLDTMRPNLTIAAEDGTHLDTAGVPDAMHQNSLRHITARADGLVACAFQWQGDAFDSPTLLALYRAGQGLDFIPFDDAVTRQMVGYAGSVALSSDGTGLAVTSPRGGLVVSVDIATRASTIARRPDICGVAPGSDAIIATDGLGQVHRLSDRLQPLASHPLAFDNHLVAI